MPKQKSIGALWVRESKGKKYLTGNIETNALIDTGESKVKLVVFKNDYKKEDRHPDYRIFISQPREEGEAF
jgi:uncharacterized protein (DUF736 family)